MSCIYDYKDKHDTYVCMTCRYTHILCISCVLYSCFSVEGQYMENQYGSPVRLQMLLLGWWDVRGLWSVPSVPLRPVQL